MQSFLEVFAAIDFRLDLSCLFYLCKFNLAAYKKFWKGAFCMDYEAKFAEVKQAR